MKKIAFLLTILLSLNLYSQDTSYIATIAQCEMCEDRIESKLNKIKGIHSADLNLETNVITVIYDAKQASIVSIEKLINLIGYDANKRLAKNSAIKRLPACCRKDYSGSH